MKILDCTLRDGGYYTNWDFNKELVHTYLDSFEKLPVQYLEVGYRSLPLTGYLGEFFYCPIQVLEAIQQRSNKQLVIILNEKDVRPNHIDPLLSPCQGLIKMVRIAIDPKNFERALKLATSIKKLGFDVGFNVMYMSTWSSQKNFLSLIKEVNGLADYFYMVDSFGGVYPNDVINTIEMVKTSTNVPIGFHGHNNLELALINTLTAIEHGAEIVDATITGMGRGAGNLKTELLLTTLHAKLKLEVNFNALSAVVTPFAALQEGYKWGTNLPYMVSGANSLPQKDVMEWVTKRFYSFNSIIRALHNQKNGDKDNENLPMFKPSKSKDTVIIIGGGPMAIMHAHAIINWISKQKNIAIIHASSRNARQYQSLEVDQYFCLAGNEGNRLEQVFSDLSNFNGTCVLPPYPRKMGTYIPEKVRPFSRQLEQVTFTEELMDTHTALALQVSIELGANELFFVGYDGYQEGFSQKEMELLSENEQLFAYFKSQSNADLIALTPTKYKELAQASIYSKIIP